MSTIRSMSTIGSLIMVFVIILGLNFPQAISAGPAGPKEVSPKEALAKNEAKKIIDKKAGFILEKNSLKAIKQPKIVKKKKSSKKKSVIAKSYKKASKVSYSKAKTLGKGKVMTVPATAYSSTVAQCDSSPFITASGTRVHFGTVAANFLPFGTRIKIPDHFGDKVFVVEDRMSRRYWHKIDIWMPSYGQAISFGKRNVRIVILN